MSSLVLYCFRDINRKQKQISDDLLGINSRVTKMVNNNFLILNMNIIKARKGITLFILQVLIVFCDIASAETVISCPGLEEREVKQIILF